MPTLYPEGVSFHWTQPVAFLGVGLVAVAFARLAPARPPAGPDAAIPTCAESLRYRQP